MDYLEINKIIQQPKLLQNLDTETIQKWVSEYPHLAILRYFLAIKNIHTATIDEKTIVQNVAFYVPDRLKLYHLLNNGNNNNFIVLEAEKETIEKREIEVFETPNLAENEVEIITENIIEKPEIETIENLFESIEIEEIETPNLVENEVEIIEENTIENSEIETIENLTESIEIEEIETPNLVENEEKIIEENTIEISEIEAIENLTESIEIEEIETPNLVENEVEIIEENTIEISEIEAVENLTESIEIEEIETPNLVENEVEIITENTIEISEMSETTNQEGTPGGGHEGHRGGGNSEIEAVENIIINKKMDAAEEMLETLKALQLARKKYSPIWYNTANINDDKIKETEEEFRKIAASNDKILAAQNIEFISEEIQSSEKQNLQEIKQDQQVDLIKNETLEIIAEQIEDSFELVEKEDLTQIEENEYKETIEIKESENLISEEIILDKEIELKKEETNIEAKNIEVTKETKIEKIDIEEPNTSKIKEIIIEANDNTHSFMEWLEILDTNITVSSVEREPNEKLENIDEEILKVESKPIENLVEKPIEKKIPAKKPIKRIANPKATPQVDKIEIEKEVIEEPISEKSPASTSKNVIPNLDERILPTKGRIIRDKDVDKRAIESISFNSALASETLAQLYERQGKKIKAIEIYKLLMVKNPKKKRFFASQIKKLESE
ncbi:MAG: hypothetical protein IPP53_07145 [Bacteroidetes bacterium]|nr:hypothetical protein [Bacteroidota bacterium]